MNNRHLITILIAIILGTIGYFVFPYVLTNLSHQGAIGILVGALLSPYIVQAICKDANNTNQDIKTLYVGNLPYRANEAAVRTLFSNHGYVHSVRLMKDKQTGKRRGFGFVEIAASSAKSAINALNDSEFQQRTLKVREAKERPEHN
ncbi:RNA recognition motif domain-containing protein [Thalassotalea agarivorans]|uniref:RNA recognition motif. (A.k.a. RRM, RBD, or RNP domain) n=1 Tax=Thalassotalea agarivorans TaxID=349064 RepID=A0A1I0GP14_THASX|nr:RNA-binding protein [Thalassotalea agarivorans]SET73018.1 RNA recognition motif. (a.k.a. RRM, RBD, or RNP domain) [Thalassotalea agarivorans]